MVINEITIFPASGNRDRADGKLYHSGSWGLVWASTPSDGRAWAIECYSAAVSLYGDFRDRGFSVRCVQASATVFAFTKDTFVFFPAAGHRASGSGILYASDTNGYGWSSTQSGGKAYNLTFGSGGANMHLNENRGHGFSVRCVQASATVWIYLEKGLKQIRYRRESGKARLCRRGQADSVIRLGRKFSVGHSFLLCAAPSYLFPLIKLPVFECLYFYKHSSDYFLFFPASGFRHYDNGKLSYSDAWGYGWSSTTSSSGYAFRLDVGSGSACIGREVCHYGFPVRCVQASAPVFVFIKNTFVFFPASGHRNYGDGSLRELGGSGFGWSSTPFNSSYTWYMLFYSGNACMITNNRGYGFPVRCVQASVAVFAFSNYLKWRKKAA